MITFTRLNSRSVRVVRNGTTTLGFIEDVGSAGEHAWQFHPHGVAPVGRGGPSFEEVEDAKHYVLGVYE